MNVLYFDPKFATARRAAPTRAYTFARHLVDHGHRVTLVGRDTRHLEIGGAATRRRFAHRECVDGIDVVRLNIPYAQSFSKWQRVLSFGGYTVASTIVGARAPRPDVIYASSTPLTVGITGALTSRLKRAPFVFELQDLWPEVAIDLGVLHRRWEIAVAERLEHGLYARAAAIVVCSEPVREALVEARVPAERIVVIPNVSDNALFDAATANRGYFDSLGLEGKFVALYTGAMGKSNGTLQLAEAARELERREVREVAIVALGFGNEREALMRQAATLPNLVVPPPVQRADIAGIVKAADATLTIFAPYKSLQTNSPNKLFDSFAAGRPVVLNVDGWLRSIVEDNRAGLYAPAGEGEALANAILELARDPKLAEELGRNGRRVAEREFDAELLAGRLRKTLEAIARRDGRAS
jgi:glycosyltransferase involved in cell wall biosynthesis